MAPLLTGSTKIQTSLKKNIQSYNTVQIKRLVVRTYDTLKIMGRKRFLSFRRYSGYNEVGGGGGGHDQGEA